MNDFDTFYDYVLLNLDDQTKYEKREDHLNIRSLILVYERYLKTIFESFEDSDIPVKNRIINDTIFTELMFERIKNALNNGNFDDFILYIKKELFRLGFLSKVGIKKPDMNIVTCDYALKLLWDLQVVQEKRDGIYVRRKMKEESINITDEEMNWLMCLYTRPEEVFFDNKVAQK